MRMPQKNRKVQLISANIGFVTRTFWNVYILKCNYYQWENWYISIFCSHKVRKKTVYMSICIYQLKFTCIYTKFIQTYHKRLKCSTIVFQDLPSYSKSLSWISPQMYSPFIAAFKIQYILVEALTLLLCCPEVHQVTRFRTYSAQESTLGSRLEFLAGKICCVPYEYLLFY